MTFGATPEAWRHFADRLGLAPHLLPVVSNPDAVVADRSKMKALGKTPSVYDQSREVVGLAKWTQRDATPIDIARWSRESDYGICIQTRAIRAIDIDVADVALADEIEKAVAGALDGIALPKRFRANSGKRLLGFRYAEPMPKRVIPVAGGMIEFLGDGQQFIAAGAHIDSRQGYAGARYQWDCDGGLPQHIPALTSEEVEAVFSTLVALFATGEPRIAREKRVGADIDLGATRDELATWLAENWEVYGTGHDGRLYLRCPFEHEHTSDSGETSTAYLVAGTGGYERGHWVCLHAHCTGRDDHEFTTATGYIAARFEVLPPLAEAPSPTAAPAPSIVTPHTQLLRPEPLPDVMPAPEYGMPRLIRDSKGAIEPLADNINKIVQRPDVVMMRLGFDAFRDEIVWAPYGPGHDPAAPAWRAFGDDDYTRLRIMLERRAVKGFGIEALRAGVLFAAKQNPMDSAQEWLSRLTWDGTPRIAGFVPRYFGCADTPYARAIGRYLWTALAGRVLSPGVQADMAPIFYGAQGARKTSAIKAMAPIPETYTDIDLQDRDENLSRRLRGKLIGELEELRGLNSRDAEGIKAWVSRTHEEWIPKFREFGTKFARRLVLMGTTNIERMLADSTGERRWLPLEVGTHGPIDPEGIAAMRDQLWAEGAAVFALDGVQWEGAERLAVAEHQRFKVEDAWLEPVERWLRAPADVTGKTPLDDPEGVSLTAVMSGALGISVAQMDNTKRQRLERVMKAIGLRENGKRWALD